MPQKLAKLDELNFY